MPSPAGNRGRVLFYVAVALLVIERLGLAGLALSNLGQSSFNWTSVILPLTHIAVVFFLLYTSDILIYWLVIMWGIITSGSYAWNLWALWNKLSPAGKAEWFDKFLPSWLPLAALAVFHLFLTLLFLAPSIRHYLAQQRSKLDFEDTPPESTTAPK